MAVKKRRLGDLYVLGKELEFDDGQGEPVVVWLQKLNPVEHEMAFRKASAVRSKILASSEEEGNIDLEISRDEIDAMTVDQIADQLASEDVAKKVAALQGELEAEEEWSKDDYLQGLRDAAEDLDPNSPDAESILEALDRFNEALNKLVSDEKEAAKRGYLDMDEATLRSKAESRLLQTRADIGWLTEFRKSEVWLAVREPDNHRKQYFENREEIDHLSSEVLTRLLDEYSKLTVDPLEVKGSAGTPSSSPSSESSDREGTADHSGHESAAA